MNLYLNGTLLLLLLLLLLLTSNVFIVGGSVIQRKTGQYNNVEFYKYVGFALFTGQEGP
jgi:hypothetical protein